MSCLVRILFAISSQLSAENKNRERNQRPRSETRLYLVPGIVSTLSPLPAVDELSIRARPVATQIDTPPAALHTR